MTTPAGNYTKTYRVSSVSEVTGNANDGVRIMVSFTEDYPDDYQGPRWGAPFSINLTAAEAASYFPGQKYVVTVTPETA